jgi:integrase
MDDNAVRDEFYAALNRAKLGHLRWLSPPSDDDADGVLRDDAIVFHDLRHTFGTQCAAKGIDLRRIQAWMGHADIQTTMRYLHYVPAHDDAARLSAAFTAESAPSLVRRDRHDERCGAADLVEAE